MNVFNLTKHAATAAQLSDGAVDVPLAQQSNLSLFTAMPTAGEMKDRAEGLIKLAVAAGAAPGDGVLIAGAMYFIPPLMEAAKKAGLTPVFSFTQRVATEQPDGQGGVKLSYVFSHEGWMLG